MAIFVSTLEQSTTQRLAPAELRALVLWLLHKMDVSCTEVEQDLYRLTLPASQQAAFEGRRQVLFTFDAQRYDSAAENDLEFAAPGHRLFTWVIQYALAIGAIQQMAPADQPENVSEITSRLFSAYTVNGGSVHLAGCSLEDRWIVKLVAQATPAATQREILIAPDGNELAAKMQSELQGCSLVLAKSPADASLGELRIAGPHSSQLPISRHEITLIFRQIQSGLRGFLNSSGHGLSEGGAESAGALTNLMQGVSQIVLVRTRWVSGKLRFTLGGESLDVPFAGWARSLQPPLVECPRSGKQTRNLAATDDHRMAAEESIASCQISGRRLLDTELAICVVTGKRVLPDYVEKCSFSGEAVLAESIVRCGRCEQPVSPLAMAGNCCLACRHQEAIKPSDPRLSLILNEYANLGHWKRWRLAETDANFITTARRGFRKMMLVVDKETLQVRYLAKANLRLGWLPIESAEEQAEILGIWS